MMASLSFNLLFNFLSEEYSREQSIVILVFSFEVPSLDSLHCLTLQYLLIFFLLFLFPPLLLFSSSVWVQ